MSNHFHLLVEVPKQPVDSELPKDSALMKVRVYLGDRIANDLK